MQKIFDKIIEQLEERRMLHADLAQSDKLTEQEREVQSRFCGCFCKAKEIVKRVFEEYKDFDLVFAKKCVELAEKMNVCDLVSENCRLSRINRFSEVELEVLSKKNHSLEIALEAAGQSSSGWILCNENYKNFPADYERVRVTLWCGEEFIGYRKDGKWFVYGGCGLAEADVIAWQLTNPFQPKTEKQKMEEDDNGWISGEILPEDGVDVLVWFEYFRYGEYNRLFQTMGISNTFRGEWSSFVNGQSGWHQLRIIKWQPLPAAPENGE